jgi:glycosyltransferase involved in cell wall biosynthesis
MERRGQGRLLVRQISKRGLKMAAVSVVMSVFNGAPSLPATLDSVLGQRDCSFEFIVVNDGSDDSSGEILDQWASHDARLRVIHQANTGLTRALAKACKQATGDFIARQDCGDLSLPGRLARQHEFLRAHPEAVLLAGGVRYVGPADEPLFETLRPGDELHDGLAAVEVSQLSGPPHHGATMFRRSAYESAGGYRLPFVVAQDLDLWLRLREIGRCVGEPEVGYQARLEPASISAQRRDDQLRLAALALRCAQRRREGLSESELLDSPAFQSSVTARRNPRRERARFFYFIGSCLRQTDPPAARRYYLQAFREYPWHFKGWIRLALG